MIFYGMEAFGFEITMKARQAIAFDVSSNTFLFQKNVDEQIHPSSMTKIMVLYTAFEAIKSKLVKQEDLVTVSEYASKSRRPLLFVKKGQSVQIHDLVQGVAILSADDAAIALAEGISGSEENFVNKMNSLAEKIGLKNTKYLNVTGYKKHDQKTTIRDMVLLSAGLLRDYPNYYSMLSEPRIRFNGIQQKNNNRLLSKENAIDGIRSWWTDDEGYGVILSTIRNDRRVIIGVNGLKTEAERAVEARRILLYALNNFDSKKVVQKGKKLGTVSISNGQKKELPIIANSDIIISFERSSHKNVKVKLIHDNFINAPIAKNQKIAELRISSPKLEDRTIPIYSTEDVGEVGRFEKFINKLFHRN